MKQRLSIVLILTFITSGCGAHRGFFDELTGQVWPEYVAIHWPVTSLPDSDAETDVSEEEIEDYPRAMREWLLRNDIEVLKVWIEVIECVECDGVEVNDYVYLINALDLGTAEHLGFVRGDFIPPPDPPVKYTPFSPSTASLSDADDQG